MVSEENETLHCPSCDWRGSGAGRFCPSCGRDLAQSSSLGDPLIGEVIQERYRIVREVGRGGMGVVYEVEHIAMGKIMAMKLLHSNVTNRPHAVKRFRQEIKVVSRLSHVHTVSVFDCGLCPNNGLFIVMEYLRGLDLERLLQHERVLSCLRAARIARQVCASLAEAHEKGIVHRDIKPANIMLLRDRGWSDLVKVLDFGIAKLIESGKEMVTETGLIVGTPFYMAPEQAMGGTALGPAIDIYSLGIVLYEMVTGRLPFLGKSTTDLIEAHLCYEPTPPSLATTAQTIDKELEDLILCAIRKTPSKRFPSIEAMQLALDDYIEGRSLAVRGRVTYAPAPTPTPETALQRRNTSELTAESLPKRKTTRRVLVQTSVFASEVPEFKEEKLDGADSSVGPSRGTAAFNREPELLFGNDAVKREEADAPLSFESAEAVVSFSLSEAEEESGALSDELQGALQKQQVDDEISHNKTSGTVALPPLGLEEPAPEKLATRADWDAVQSRWERRSRLRWLLPLLLLCGGLGWLGWMGWKQYQTRLFPQLLQEERLRAEREPNNNPLEATPVAFNAWISGTLGERQSNSSSDRDWFLLRPSGQDISISVTLKPPRTIDMELCLYELRERREGGKVIRSPRELRAVNDRRRGGLERIASWHLRKGRTYYLLVRELVVVGEAPQEFQGKYQLQIKQSDLFPNREVEPNDQLAQALQVRGKTWYYGYHDRSGDTDFYRLILKGKERRRCRIRFYLTGRSMPDFLLLTPEGRPIPVVRRRRQSRIPARSKSRRSKRRVFYADLQFSAANAYIFRVRGSSAQLAKPYRFRLICR